MHLLINGLQFNTNPGLGKRQFSETGRTGAHLDTTTSRERLVSLNAGFIRQRTEPDGPLPDISGVPVVVSRCTRRVGRVESIFREGVVAGVSRRTSMVAVGLAPTGVGGYAFLNPPWEEGVEET